MQVKVNSFVDGWDTYFGNMASLAATRASCPRASVGCVVVRDNLVIVTGYNGSLPGKPHCSQEGCIMVNDHCVRTIHAEVNAILQAAKRGVSIQGGTAYITHSPCANCQKLLEGAGVERVYYASKYGS